MNSIVKFLRSSDLDKLQYKVNSFSERKDIKVVYTKYYNFPYYDNDGLQRTKHMVMVCYVYRNLEEFQVTLPEISESNRPASFVGGNYSAEY